MAICCVRDLFNHTTNRPNMAYHPLLVINKQCDPNQFQMNDEGSGIYPFLNSKGVSWLSVNSIDVITEATNWKKVNVVIYCKRQQNILRHRKKTTYATPPNRYTYIPSKTKSTAALMSPFLSRITARASFSEKRPRNNSWSRLAWWKTRSLTYWTLPESNVGHIYVKTGNIAIVLTYYTCTSVATFSQVNDRLWL